MSAPTSNRGEHAVVDLDEALHQKGVSVDIADHIAGLARELFKHLPEGEVGDDDSLHFTLGPGGALVVRLATGVTYTCIDGCTCRMRQVAGDEAEIAVFQDGKVIELLALDLSAIEDQKWKNVPRVD